MYRTGLGLVGGASAASEATQFMTIEIHDICRIIIVRAT